MFQDQSFFELSFKKTEKKQTERQTHTHTDSDKDSLVTKKHPSITILVMRIAKGTK